MRFNPFDQETNGITVAEKQDILPIQKKSSLLSDWPWLINGGSKGNTTMTIKRALNFYDDAAPVATAIDWINDEFKTLSLLLKNGDKVEKDADILRFLARPNDDMTQEDFLETTGAYFSITNEVYWMATGREGRKPAEMLVISPEFVTVKKGTDGFITQMTIQSNGMTQMVFNRSEKGFRFFTADGDKELWQVKGFSALGDSVGQSGVTGTGFLNNARGRSKLSSIHREINQYIEIARHNLASLDNGMIPSGILSVPDGHTLDDDQFERLREQIVNFYSGADNARKTMILDNGLIWTPTNKNGIDMDFEKGTKVTTITIFNRFKVPLPLISPDNMTLANMDTSRLNLYDNAVLPLAHRLFRELTNFLAPRFGLTEDMLLVPNLDKIAALQIRRNEELKLKKEIDVYSKNELRMEVGKEKMDGGDILYMTNNMIPLGSTPVPTTNSGQTTANTNDTSNDAAKSKSPITSRKEFIVTMQSQLNKEGKRLFTDNEIDEIADSEGL